MSALRRYLIAGLLVWLPILATVLVVKFLIDLVDSTLLILPGSGSRISCSVCISPDWGCCSPGSCCSSPAWW